MLERLAEARFAPLREAERAVVRNAAGPEPTDCASVADRAVRAELVRWLVADRDLEDEHGLNAIRVRHADVVGTLDLRNVATSKVVVLEDCNLAWVRLTNASLRSTSLDGSSCTRIDGDGLRVDGSLRVGESAENPFRADGPVVLLGASISGDLACEGGSFSALNDDARGAETLLRDHYLYVALPLERATIGGEAFLRGPFRSSGMVNILNCKIGGNLDCSGASIFLDPAIAVRVEARWRRVALAARGAEIHGELILGPYRDEDPFVEGIVELSNTRLGSNV